MAIAHPQRHVGKNGGSANLLSDSAKEMGATNTVTTWDRVRRHETGDGGRGMQGNLITPFPSAPQ